jgi:hypothetical protein
MKKAQIKSGIKIIYYGIFAAVLAFGFAVGFLLIGIKIADDIHQGRYAGSIGVLCMVIVLVALTIRNRKRAARLRSSIAPAGKKS